MSEYELRVALLLPNLGNKMGEMADGQIRGERVYGGSLAMRGWYLH